MNSKHKSQDLDHRALLVRSTSINACGVLGVRAEFKFSGGSLTYKCLSRNYTLKKKKKKNLRPAAADRVSVCAKKKREISSEKRDIKEKEKKKLRLERRTLYLSRFY